MTGAVVSDSDVQVYPVDLVMRPKSTITRSRSKIWKIWTQTTRTTTATAIMIRTTSINVETVSFRAPFEKNVGEKQGDGLSAEHLVLKWINPIGAKKAIGDKSRMIDCKPKKAMEEGERKGKGEAKKGKERVKTRARRGDKVTFSVMLFSFVGLLIVFPPHS